MSVLRLKFALIKERLFYIFPFFYWAIIACYTAIFFIIMAITIAYLRVSTNKQTLENQRSEIKRFAEKNELVIDKWVEEVVSGKERYSDRKLGYTLKRLKRGDTLIISELSRLSRTLLEIMSIMRSLLERGVTLYSVKENFCLSDSISSKVILFAFGLAAEIERDLISVRTKEALAARKEQGMSLGRKRGCCPKMEMLMSKKQEILSLHTQGTSISNLCEIYDVSRGTMSKFLHDVSRT